MLISTPTETQRRGNTHQFQILGSRISASTLSSRNNSFACRETICLCLNNDLSTGTNLSPHDRQSQATERLAALRRERCTISRIAVICRHNLTRSRCDRERDLVIGLGNCISVIVNHSNRDKGEIFAITVDLGSISSNNQRRSSADSPMGSGRPFFTILPSLDTDFTWRVGHIVPAKTVVVLSTFLTTG